MKKLLKSVLVLLFLVSCKETPKSTESSNINSLIKEVSGQNAEKEKNYAQLFEKLIAKTPISNTQFLEAFPKKLGDLSLDALPEKNIDHMDANTQDIIGNFGDGAIKVEITDAVGQNASLAVSHLKSYDLINYESDDNTKYIKKERNGIKTAGVYEVGANDSELKFLYDNRFYVSIEAKGMGLDKLWENFDAETSLSPYKKLNH